jgi:pilus assembly protein CpaD
MTVSRLSRSLFVVAGLSAALGLAGCATTSAPDAVAEPRTPTEQFPIDVVPTPVEIQLAIHAKGLSPTQAEALAGFADRWREASGGAIVIQAPKGAGDQASVYRMSEGARAFLIDQGAPPQAIRVASYDAGGKAGAPLIVGYQTYVARGPVCGEHWEGLTHSAGNRTSSNFGCAITANMAAQIADPRDLIEPRATEPGDAQRRVEALAKYRKGENTSAAKDAAASGAVSRAVN